MGSGPPAAVIVAACRTAMGTAPKGSLAETLATLAIRELLTTARTPTRSRYPAGDIDPRAGHVLPGC
jgi:hypothetical protein